MNICKRLKSTNTLDNYIELTQELEKKQEEFEVELNEQTLLSLKKIRSLEIEYFNKCHGSGVAFKMFERLVRKPPSRAWGLLGPDLINLLVYWLDAVRKHLMSHHTQWWTFLKHLLGFIRDIRHKDHSLSDVLVRMVSESMLDLATRAKVDLAQRYEILQIFNDICAESSREIRLTLWPLLEAYFIRVSLLLAQCGDLPSQLSSLMALLRWLQPRHELRVRQRAAAQWFPPHLYSKDAVNVFLERNWFNFLQDSRDFLNCHNEKSDLVTSVVCKFLKIGDTVVVSGREHRTTWLDINVGGARVSALLEPAQLAALRPGAGPASDTLAIHTDIVDSVLLHRVSSLATISIVTLEAPSLLASSQALERRQCDVTIVVSNNTDLTRLDAALTAVYKDKYQLMLDINAVGPSSFSATQCSGSRRNSMEAPCTTSVQEKRLRGGVFRPMSWKSPSSVSTTSLAQLPFKLAALPKYEFPKDFSVSVCAHPALPAVSEQNESDISSTIDNTFKLQRFGVASKRLVGKFHSDGEANLSGHTTETNKNPKGSKSDNEQLRKPPNDGNVSKLFAELCDNDDSIISATIEHMPKTKDLNADNLLKLLVKEALEDRGVDSGIITGDSRKSNNADDVETIEDTQYTGVNVRTKARKSLKSVEKCTSDESNNEPADNSVGGTEAQRNSKVLEKSTSNESNTEPVNEPIKNVIGTRSRKKFKVVEKSTSDESNIEPTDNSINNVTVRKRGQRRNSTKNNKVVESNKENEALKNKNTVEKYTENATFDDQAVEDFFNQHFATNQLGELIISPALAKKINETSSEASDNCVFDEDFDLPNDELPDIEIVNCMNNILDQVCEEFEKCSEYFDKQSPVTKHLKMVKNVASVASTEQNLPLQDVGNLPTEAKKKEKPKSNKKTPSTSKPVIKLKFNTKKQTAKSKGNKRKLELEPVCQMSVIVEERNESIGNKTPENKVTASNSDTNAPLVRRKRKLYSPKDDEINFENTDTMSKPVEDDVQSDDILLAELKKDKLSTPKFKDSKKYKLPTPKSTSTCYKELEKERQKIKKTRAQKLQAILASPPSPKTRKLNDDFERLKDNIESNENVKLINKKSDKDLVIFNFTSDSEDEDFIQKKIEVQKRTSTTTIGSANSLSSRRRGRTVKTEYKERARDSSSDPTCKPVRRKRVTKRKPKSKACEVKIDPPKELIDERMREAAPEVFNTSFTAEKGIEVVKELTPKIKAPELEVILDDRDIVIEKNKKAKPTKTQKNKKQDFSPLNVIRDDDRTVSPLPGLVIETENVRNDVEDSLTTNLVEKCQNMYKYGPDAYNDTGTTQNMLSDNDKVPSPRMNITEELRKAYEDNAQNNYKTKVSDDQNYNSDVIDDTMNSGCATDCQSSKKSKKDKLRLKPKSKTETTNNNISVKDDTICKAKKNTIHLSFKDTKIVKKDDSQKSEPKRITASTAEIICQKIIPDSEIITRSKSGKSSRNDEIETVHLSINSDHEEERSIPAGINAQGDINESPRRPNMLKEDLIDISIESEGDEEQFILFDGINAHEDKNELPPSSKSLKEPLIDLSIDSDGEEERSIPSDGINAHGDTNELPPSPELLNQQLIPREIIDMDDHIKKYYVEYNRRVMLSKDSTENQQSGNNKKKPTEEIIDSSSSEKSNTIKQKEIPAKMSAFEKYSYDLRKLLPSRHGTESETSQSSHKKSPTSSITRILPADIVKTLTPTVSLIRLSPKDISKWQPSAKTTPESSFVTAKSKTPMGPRAINAKSKISPIQFDKFFGKRKQVSPDTTKSQDDTLTPQEDETKIDWHFKPTRSQETLESKVSSPKLPPKLKIPVSKPTDAKRKKLGTNYTEVDEPASVQSSNVNSWLRSASPSGTALNAAALEDVLQNITERMDTTLLEIHQRTAKDFISLFAEAHSQLSEMKEERRKAIAELNQREEERAMRFECWMKERASDLLRQDCVRKRAMVRLLQQDVKAVTDYLSRRQD